MFSTAFRPISLRLLNPNDMAESSRERREKDLKKAEDHRKHFEDMVRRKRAQLDRTHLHSVARKPLEKAFEKLISQRPTESSESNEDDDGLF